MRAADVGPCGLPASLARELVTTSLVLSSLALAIPAAHSAGVWEHNGSTVYLESDGLARKFIYRTPRSGLPVRPGTLLFQGKQNGDRYSGTAYRFSRSCGAIGYAVTGSVAEDGRTVTMFGKAPRRNAGCKVIGFRADTLVFRNGETPGAEAPKKTAEGDDSAAGADTPREQRQSAVAAPEMTNTPREQRQSAAPAPSWSDNPCILKGKRVFGAHCQERPYGFGCLLTDRYMANRQPVQSLLSLGECLKGCTEHPRSCAADAAEGAHDGKDVFAAMAQSRTGGWTGWVRLTAGAKQTYCDYSVELGEQDFQFSELSVTLRFSCGESQ